MVLIMGHLVNASGCEVFDNPKAAFKKIFTSDSLEVVQEFNLIYYGDKNANHEIRENDGIDKTTIDSLAYIIWGYRTHYTLRRKNYQGGQLVISKTDTLFLYYKNGIISERNWEACWNSKTGACFCEVDEKDTSGHDHSHSYKEFPLSYKISDIKRDFISNWEQFKEYVAAQRVTKTLFNCQMNSFGGEYPCIQRVIFKDGEIIENEKIHVCDCIFDFLEE